jgi:Zn finger protein HypA/HybF involved in hydrogenase expression
MAKTKLRKYTEAQFKEAVRTSFSIYQTMTKLGVCAQGSAYRSFKEAVKDWKVDTTHFTGMLWSKGRALPPKRVLSEYLSNKFKIGSHVLRLRLIKEGIFKAECSKCLNSDWNGQPIALELEHINGDHDDNTLTNLTLLCPNCHAQTATYCGKNKKPGKVKVPFIRPVVAIKTCLDCGIKVDRKAIRCRSCSGKQKAVDQRESGKLITWPDLPMLVELVKELGYRQTGKRLGVSDNTVRRHIERNS